MRAIDEGKDGYQPFRFWTERTEKALTDPELYRYDTGQYDNDAYIPWIKGILDSRLLGHVLEVGTGFGRWADVIRGRYRTFTGVDPIQRRVLHANRVFGAPNVSFWHTDHKFPPASFDTILSVTVIQHLTMPEAVGVLRLIAEYLKPDGVALLAEGRLYQFASEDDADKLYLDRKTPSHMIPKSIPALRAAVPQLAWSGEKGRYTLRVTNA